MGIDRARLGAGIKGPEAYVQYLVLLASQRHVTLFSEVPRSPRVGLMNSTQRSLRDLEPDKPLRVSRGLQDSNGPRFRENGLVEARLIRWR